jgi:hypothetical protein
MDEKGGVSQAMILNACQVGDVPKLRLWTSWGIYVHNNEAVQSAVMCEHLHVLRYLIGDLGADVHQVDECGLTLLLRAAHRKLLDVMRCLVKEFGADVNRLAVDFEGNQLTPLVTAVQLNVVDIIRVLVKEFGADVNQPAVSCQGNQRPLWSWPSNLTR